MENDRKRWWRDAWAEACEECADHLELEWAEQPIERKAGKVLEDRLRKMASHPPREPKTTG